MKVVAIATNAMVVLLCATMPSPSSSCYYAIVTTQHVMVVKPRTNKRKKRPLPKRWRQLLLLQV